MKKRVFLWFWIGACFALNLGLADPIVLPMQKEEGGRVKAGYLSMPRDKPIDRSTYLYVKYALESFVQQNVSFILLDLDTPGGEVFSALSIEQELHKVDKEQGIPVIALVDDWALSAGALLAYSCRFIGTTGQGSMGAAEPVIASPDGKIETASEKMVSALRTEFAKAAQFYGRNPLIAQAMVDKDLVVVQREGQILELLEDSQIQSKDLVISAKGKLLTLDAEQMQTFGITNFLASSTLYTPLSGKEIVSKESFCSFPIEWVSYENWKITFFAFLTHPFVSSLLLIGFLTGLYTTIQTQMWGFSSCISLCCLVGILLPMFSLQVIAWLELIVLGLGLSLLLLDLALVGSWFLGGVGLLLILCGLITLLLPSLEGVTFSWEPKEWGVVLSEWVYRLSLFLSSVFAAITLSGLASRYLMRRGFLARRIALKNTEERLEEKKKKFPPISSVGLSVSALRPMGRIQIEGNFYEAETSGEFIVVDTKIIVIKHLQQRVRVKEFLPGGSDSCF